MPPPEEGGRGVGPPSNEVNAPRRHAENGSTTQSTGFLPKHLAAYSTDIRREILRVSFHPLVLLRFSE